MRIVTLVYVIYKTTNLINGNIYVGAHATENIEDPYLGSGRVLSIAIKKYGRENFKREILHTFVTSQEMYAKEAEIVNEEFIKRKDVYNRKTGGIGAPLGNEYGKSSWFKPGNPYSIKPGEPRALGVKRSAAFKASVSKNMLGNQNARKHYGITQTS